MKQTVTAAAILVSLVLAACGAGAPPEATKPEPSFPATGGDGGGDVQIEGLYGKIDDSIVEDVFRRNMSGIMACYENEALEVLEEIEGTLTLFILVDRDGVVTEIYFRDGEFGSDAAQKCMLRQISKIEFPDPIGGTKAEIIYSLPFEEPYDHPAPFDWSGEQVENVMAANDGDISACLEGKTGITFTLYVGYRGKVLAAGGAADSIEGYEAAECLSSAAMKWKFPDPGKQRPAKAVVRF